MSGDPFWKGEGGFKNGFMLRLEQILCEKFPGCGIKAIPHVDSKLKWFKDKHAVISEMLNKSGFSWDYEHMKLTCEKQSYEDFVKLHPKAGGLWNAPFPYLEKLDTIYGIDRANGKRCELIDESIDLCAKDSEPCINLDEDGVIDKISVNGDSPYAPPPSKKPKREKTPTSKEPKRMSNVIDLTSVGNIETQLGGFIKDIGSHMAAIANVMTTTQKHEEKIMNREEETIEKRRNLLSEIATLPGITDMQVIRASKLLAASPSDMEIFYATPTPEWKKKFIIELLGIDISSMGF